MVDENMQPNLPNGDDTNSRSTYLSSGEMQSFSQGLDNQIEIIKNQTALNRENGLIAEAALFRKYEEATVAWQKRLGAPAVHGRLNEGRHRLSTQQTQRREKLQPAQKPHRRFRFPLTNTRAIAIVTVLAVCLLVAVSLFAGGYSTLGRLGQILELGEPDKQSASTDIISTVLSGGGGEPVAKATAVTGSSTVYDPKHAANVTDLVELATHEVQRWGRGEIEDIAISSTGDRMAVATPFGVWVYRLDEPDNGRLLPYPFPIEAHVVSFSPDGTYIAVSVSDTRFDERSSTVHVWDVASGGEVAQFDVHNGFIQSIAFSPDGAWFAAGADDESVRVWDVASGEQVAQLDGHDTGVWSVSFSPDGTYIASGDTSTVRLWDVAGNRLVTQFNGHDGQIRSVAFSPDGTHIAASGARVWDVTSGKQIAEFDGPRGRDRWVSFQPDGERIILGSSDGEMQVWDVASGEQVAQLNGNFGTDIDPPADTTDIDPPTYHTRSFTLSGELYYTHNRDGSVQVWDVASGKQIAQFNGHFDQITSATFSPDGEQVVATGYELLQGWDVETGSQMVQMVDGLRGKISTASFSRDGERIISGEVSGIVQVWDVASGERLAEVHGHFGDVISAFISPDGKRTISSSVHGTVRVRDMASGEQIAELLGQNDIRNNSSLSPDGAMVVWGREDGTVQVWDVASGEQVAQFVDHFDQIISVAFSPNGEQIVVHSFDTVRVWDVASSEQVAGFTHHNGGFVSAALSPNGERVVTGSLFGPVQVWDVASGEQIAHFNGHIDSVESVSFSPDGERAVSSSRDGTVRVWNID